MSDSQESPASTSFDSHESSTTTTFDPPSKTSDPLVLQTSTMAPIDRSEGRNVHIYDAENPTVVLGGLILSNGVTNANLYSMLDYFIVYEESFSPEDEEPFLLLDEEGSRIEKNNHPLQPGKYCIISISSIEVSNELPLLRTISVQSGTRVQSFRDAVRSRDRRCVVSGKEAKGANAHRWWGFEAAHIFPLGYEGVWNTNGFGRWISIPPETETAGTINSVQNGMLLKSDLHQLFDNYAFSINPDDNHKVVCFFEDEENIAGKHLDQRFLDDPRRPVDEVLRWHFRQAVLANMKGAGEPIFEHDFPPGSDIVGDILRGPRAAERMEFELFGRLAAQVEIGYSEVAQAAISRDGIST